MKAEKWLGRTVKHMRSSCTSIVFERFDFSDAFSGLISLEPVVSLARELLELELTHAGLIDSGLRVGSIARKAWIILHEKPWATRTISVWIRLERGGNEGMKLPMEVHGKQ
jgi:hypothetical protein